MKTVCRRPFSLERQTFCGNRAGATRAVEMTVRPGSDVPCKGTLGVTARLLFADAVIFKPVRRGSLVATILDLVLCVASVRVTMRGVVTVSRGRSLTSHGFELAPLVVLREAWVVDLTHDIETLAIESWWDWSRPALTC